MSNSTNNTRIFGKYIDTYGKKYKSNIAIIDALRNIEYTYDEVLEQVNAIAKGLIAIGIKPGDKVAIAAPVSVEFLTITLASLKIGAVVVSIDPSYKVRELKYALEVSESKILFTSLNIYTDCMSNGIRIEQLLSSGPTLYKIFTIGDKLSDLHNLIDRGEYISDTVLNIVSSSVKESDIATLHFTSGTTGKPKAVLQTHKSVIDGIGASRVTYSYKKGDIVLLALPMFHVMGGELTSLLTLSTGASLLITGPFKTNIVLAAMEKYACTAFHGVPTMYHFLMERCGSYNLKNLKTGMMGGSSTSAAERKEIMDVLALDRLINVYGQTEILAAIQTDPSESLEVQLNTAGKPIQGVTINIVDDKGNALPIGEKGEIIIHTEYCMEEYLGDTLCTNETIRDGWVYTGDLGHIDASGNITIDGRIKDIIIRGGENISPTEIESILKEHPMISNAGVVGKPDKVLGEEVCAFIETTNKKVLDIDEVKEFCSQLLAKHKIPKYIYFKNHIPTTASGKIQKFKLKEELERV